MENDFLAIDFGDRRGLEGERPLSARGAWGFREAGRISRGLMEQEENIVPDVVRCVVSILSFLCSS